MLEWIGRRYMRMQKIRHEEQGFTLIELLIVTKRSVRERSKTPLRLAMCDRVSVPLPLRVIHPSAWKGCSLKFVPSRRSMCYWGDVTPRIQNPKGTVAPAGTEASLLTLTASRRPGEGSLSFLPETVPRRVPLPGSRARRPFPS